ncbi:MAG: WYL domain-containing protein [Thermodesulfobacteriota bacterium]
MARDKPQLVRLVFIDQRIREGMASGRLANCTSLAAEYEVSPKSILRDIDYLRHMRGAPIVYDPTRKGYLYSEANWQLPALSISESDLFALCIAEKALRQHEGTPVYDRLAAIFRRIAECLPAKVSVDPSWIDRRLAVLPDQATRIDARVWEAVASGLKHNQPLAIRHRRAGTGAASQRTVEPYRAVRYQGEWYLVGFCRLRQAVRTFAMSRIEEAAVLEGCFQIPADFEAAWQERERFGLFGDGEEVWVTVGFGPALAPYVRERLWHGRQELSDQPDGGVQLRLPARDRDELLRWVLSWGDGAQILAPAGLRQEAAELLTRMLAAYRSPAAP